jgi:hypothetical protein
MLEWTQVVQNKIRLINLVQTRPYIEFNETHWAVLHMKLGRTG